MLSLLEEVGLLAENPGDTHFCLWSDSRTRIAVGHRSLFWIAVGGLFHVFIFCVFCLFCECLLWNVRTHCRIIAGLQKVTKTGGFQGDHSHVPGDCTGVLFLQSLASGVGLYEWNVFDVSVGNFLQGPFVDAPIFSNI